MNKENKAKIKYLFFHFKMYSPDVFSFEGIEYRIIDKNILKKRSTPLQSIFLILMLPLTLGDIVFKNIFYYILVFFSIFLFIFDWIKLPKDIFQYLSIKNEE